MPAIASSYVAATFANAYYRTHEEYEQAVSDAMREEYKAIVDAGFILQIDDPRLVTYYMMNPDLSVADCRKWAAQRVEAINDSIRDIPPEKVRFHTCYSIDVGPRIHEMALKDIVDIMLRSTPAPIRSKRRTRGTNTNTMSSSRSSCPTGRSSSRA